MTIFDQVIDANTKKALESGENFHKPKMHMLDKNYCIIKFQILLQNSFSNNSLNLYINKNKMVTKPQNKFVIELHMQ